MLMVEKIQEEFLPVASKVGLVILWCGLLGGIAYIGYEGYSKSQGAYEDALDLNASLFAGYVEALRRGDDPTIPPLTDARAAGENYLAGSYGRIVPPAVVGGRRIVGLMASRALCDRIARLPEDKLTGVAVNGETRPSNLSDACREDVPNKGRRVHLPNPITRNVLTVPVPGH